MFSVNTGKQTPAVNTAVENSGSRLADARGGMSLVGFLGRMGALLSFVHVLNDRKFCTRFCQTGLAISLAISQLPQSTEVNRPF